MSKNKKRNSKKMTDEQKDPIPEEAVPAEEREVEQELVTEPEEAPETNAEPEAEGFTLTAEEAKALKAKLDKLTEERDDAVRQAQRLQAEFENYRKRNAQIAADSRDDGIREAVKNILPVLDNFDRAMENAPDDQFAAGIRNISKQFVAALEKCGAEELEASGQFDPKLHDAVMKDSVEGVPSNEITAVLQKGWRVKGKIVRYAMVKVNE